MSITALFRKVLLELQLSQDHNDSEKYNLIINKQ